MKKDPAIQAIRDARSKISAAIDHDPYKLVAYYRKLQEDCRDRLISKTTDPRAKKDDSAAEGILEVLVPQGIYEKRIQQHEEVYQGGPELEVVIPQSEFDILNRSRRVLHEC